MAAGVFENLRNRYFKSADGTGTVADPFVPVVEVVGVVDGDVVIDFTAMNAYLAKLAGRGYETVAAGQTAQVLGGAGAAGDVLVRLIVIPATTSPGLVTILDGATSIPVWVGGTVGADLKPFVVELNVTAATAWKVTTGSNVSVIAVGTFT
jgi:hypothetical protein